jgi:serine/threonine protein kinase
MISGQQPEEKFEAIEAFDTVFNTKLIPLTNHITIKVPIYDANGTLVDTHQYLLDATKELGHSDSSLVYSATRIKIDAANNNPNERTPPLKSFAIKIIAHPAVTAAKSKNKDPEKIKAIIKQRLLEIQNEVKYLSRRYVTEKPLIIGEKAIFIITESLRGQELCSDDYKIHSDLVKLNFTQRTHVAAQLVSQINDLHHNKPVTGAALIHGDLKGSNVKLFIDLVTFEIEVNVMDYGISMEAPDTEESLAIHPAKLKGSFIYFPKETAKSQFGIKTDIYMLAALLVIIFGETNPYRLKTLNLPKTQLSPQQETEKFVTPYPVDQVLNFPPLYPDVNIRELALNMLNRMMANDYKDRPSTDEVTRFFVLLHKLARIHAVAPHDTRAKAVIVAQMWLMTTTEWYSHINTLGAASLSLSQAHLRQEKTLSEFDFANDTLATLTIVSICNRDLKRHLYDPSVTPTRMLLASRARAIVILSEKLLLNDEIALAICCGETAFSNFVVTTILGRKPELRPENYALLANHNSAVSARTLVQLAAHHGDWERVVHLLLLMPKTSLDKSLTHFLNKNVETLIAVANRIFKTVSDDAQLTLVCQTIQKQNALGVIMNTPTNSAAFMFSSRKFGDVKITGRSERLISDLACYQAAKDKSVSVGHSLKLSGT